MENVVYPLSAAGPLVSVLITTYNQERYIGQTLDSVLAQQCDFDYEIVIGEDCSSDRTLAVCEMYRQRYPDKISVLANPKNKGVTANYFDTFLKCRGKYIADCGGDDYWIDPYKLQKQVEILEKRSDVILVHTNWCERIEETGETVRDARGKKGGWKAVIQEGEEGMERLIDQRDCPFALLSSSCFRREPLRESYYRDPDLFRNPAYPCEDYQIWFTLLRKGVFYYLDEETTVYRINAESVSYSRTYSKEFRFYFSLFRLRLDILSRYPVPPGSLQRYGGKELTDMLWRALRAEDSAGACEVTELAKSRGVSFSLRQKAGAGVCMHRKTLQGAAYLRKLYLSLRGRSFRKRTLEIK